MFLKTAAKIKGVGRAIGLTENDTSLAKWLIAGPEVSRMVEEFGGGEWACYQIQAKFANTTILTHLRREFYIGRKRNVLRVS